MTRSFLKSLAVVLAVPLLVSAIALTARDRFEESWTLSVRRQAAMHGFRLTPRDFAGKSLAAICSNPRTSGQYPPCGVYHRFFQMSVACGATAGVGLALLGGVVLAVHLASGRRRWRPAVFRPVFLSSVVAMALLVVVQGVLAGGGLFLLGELLGTSGLSLAFLAVALAVAMAVSTLRLGRTLDSRVRLSIVGRRLDLEAHPALREMLEQVARGFGVSPPTQVVVGLVPDICLTAADVDCLDGVFTGRTLYLSLPLCRILSVTEMRAILTHEFARFAGDGGRASDEFYPVYTAIVRRRAALARRASFVSRVVEGPGWHVTGLLLDAMADAERPIGAGRDLAADRAAADAAGVDAYAAALIKLHAFEPAWDVVDEIMERSVAVGIGWENASALFAEIAVDNAGPDRLKGLSDRVRAHPTESHLPLARRLGALSVDPARVASAALDMAVAPQALSLVHGAEALEREISGALQVIKARHREALLAA